MTWQKRLPDGTRKEFMESLATVPLLIIDGFGMRKLPLTAAEDLLEIIMRRYGSPALIRRLLSRPDIRCPLPRGDGVPGEACLAATGECRTGPGGRHVPPRFSTLYYGQHRHRRKQKHP